MENHQQQENPLVEAGIVRVLDGFIEIDVIAFATLRKIDDRQALIHLLEILDGVPEGTRIRMVYEANKPFRLKK